MSSKPLFSLFVAFFLLSVVVAADVSDESQYILIFDHKANVDSSAQIYNTINFPALGSYFNALSGAMAESVKEKFEQGLNLVLPTACEKIIKKDKNFACTVANSTITLSRGFTPKDGYYSFATTGEFPYRTYRLVINKLPIDKFGRVIQVGLGPSSGESESAFSLFAGTNIIDLKKKDQNAISAQGFQMLNLNVLYKVEMPGEVTSASAGNYSAAYSGSTAKFDIVTVMENSSPLVVESRELNVFMLVIIIGVILLVLLGWAFFSTKKK